MASEAKLKANDKYLKTKETFVVRVEKGMIEKINEYVESIGMSRNEYITKLINDDMNKK